MNERVFDRRFEDGEIKPSPKLGKLARDFFGRLPPKVQFLARAGLTSLVLSTMSIFPDSADAHNQDNGQDPQTNVHRLIVESGKNGEESGTDYKDLNLEVPFADPELWYYTGGPHADGISRGARYAVDFATERIIPCPAPPVVNRHVTVAADGEVIASGKDRHWYHHDRSVVIVRHKNGLETGYMHLANIQVQVGQRVETGDFLGNPSCESPPGGRAQAVHVHFFVRDELGRPIRIAGFKLSGWQINELRGNYQGTMTKEGLQYRKAVAARCGPSEISIRICGGIRNDFGESERELREPIQEPVEEPTVEPKPENSRPVISGILVLDGRGDGVKILHSESLQLGNEITIEARVKLQGSGGSGDAILAKGESSEPYALWAGFWKCENGAMAAFFGSGEWGCALETIQPGQSVDLAVTFNKQEMIFYIDRREAGRKQVEGGLTENYEPLFVGRSPVPGNEDCGCEIDFIKLWEKVRTQEQIIADFEGEIGPVSDAEEAGLVGWWEFNGDFSDSTSNHNDGEPIGDAHIEELSELDVPRPLSRLR